MFVVDYFIENYTHLRLLSQNSHAHCTPTCVNALRLNHSQSE